MKEEGNVHMSFGGSVGRANVGSRVGSEIPTSEVFTVCLEQKHTTETEAGLQDWEGLCSSVKTRPHKLDQEILHPAQIPGWLSLTPVWLIGLIPGQCLAKSPTACLNAPCRRTRGQETQYFQSSCTIARWLQRDSLGLCASVASVPRRSRGYACHGDRAVVVVRAASGFFFFFLKLFGALLFTPSPLHYKHIKPTANGLTRFFCVSTFQKMKKIQKKKHWNVYFPTSSTHTSFVLFFECKVKYCKILLNKKHCFCLTPSMGTFTLFTNANVFAFVTLAIKCWFY